MKVFEEIFKDLPEELRNPLVRAFRAFEEEILLREIRAVRVDIEELKKTVNELAEAQKRTEQRVNELAEAQKRTEQRVNELAEAQKKTEQRVNELAEAQKRTEKELRALARELKETRRQVGGLSDAVGYGLEDRAMKSLPSLLRERFGIQVEGRLERKVFEVNGREEEVNIFGRGRRRRKRIYIVGEAKSRLSTRDIDSLIRQVERLKTAGVIPGEDVFLLAISYLIRPAVERYAREKGVEVIWSYEL